MNRAPKIFLPAVAAVFLLGVFTAEAKLALPPCGYQCVINYNLCIASLGYPPACANDYLECMRLEGCEGV